jgi:hypothetical protein
LGWSVLSNKVVTKRKKEKGDVKPFQDTKSPFAHMTIEELEELDRRGYLPRPQDANENPALGVDSRLARGLSFSEPDLRE